MNPAYTILLHHKIIKENNINNCQKCGQNKYFCQCQIINKIMNRSKKSKQKT